MRTYKLYLIRNGITQANIDGIYCGSSNPPLCELAKEQLYDILDTGSYPYAEWVFSSSMLRATQTAEILYPGCEIIEFENLREASFGEFEGVSFKEMQHNDGFQKWVTGNPEFLPKGAEPLDAFYARCQNAIVSIIDLMMRSGVHSAAVITHMSVIGNILSAIAYPKCAPYDWTCDAGYGYEVIADPTLFMREPVIEVTRKIPLRTEESYADSDEGYSDEYDI